MSKPLFVLVAGPNGAGKSTFTRTLRRHYPGITVIDPDAIARKLSGSYAGIGRVRTAAGRRAIELVRSHIQAKVSFIAESTISGHFYLHYAALAREVGFRTILLYIGLETADLSAERVAARVKLGGHKVALADILRRHPKSLRNLRPHIELFDVAHIYDNSLVRSWVAGYRGGELHKRAQCIPAWMGKELRIEN